MGKMSGSSNAGKGKETLNAADGETGTLQTTRPSQRPPEKGVTRIFYDGGCPLCRREIAHYRRLPGGDCLEWIDIDDAEAHLGRFGLDRSAAMASLHVLDANGQWQTGARAFAAIWSELPRYRWLAAILRKTHTLPLLDRAYTLFARWRLRRRCVQAADGSTNSLCLVPIEDRPSSAAPSQDRANAPNSNSK